MNMIKIKEREQDVISFFEINQIEYARNTAFRVDLRKPLPLGCYSQIIDKQSRQRHQTSDRSTLKWIPLPKNKNEGDKHYDLKKGFNVNIDYAQDDSTIESFLHWIIDNRLYFTVKNAKPTTNLNTDFICYRSILRRIMTAPFDKDKWCFEARLFNGTIYFQSDDEKETYPDQQLLTYSGYKFEDLVTYDEDERPPKSEARIEAELDTVGQFIIIFRTRIGSHSIVYAAECDAVCDWRQINDSIEKMRLVEVKTAPVIRDSRHQQSFLRHRYLKWWSQSYLGKVGTILCGYRDSNFIVKELEKIEVDDLPDMCSYYWSKNSCLAFLDDFLSFVKSHVVDDNLMYRFTRNEFNKIICTSSSDCNNDFIPDWYKRDITVLPETTR